MADIIVISNDEVTEKGQEIWITFINKYNDIEYVTTLLFTIGALCECLLNYINNKGYNILDITWPYKYFCIAYLHCICIWMQDIEDDVSTTFQYNVHNIPTPSVVPWYRVQLRGPPIPYSMSQDKGWMKKRGLGRNVKQETFESYRTWGSIIRTWYSVQR